MRFPTAMYLVHYPAAAAPTVFCAGLSVNRAGAGLGVHFGRAEIVEHPGVAVAGILSDDKGVGHAVGDVLDHRQPLVAVVDDGVVGHLTVTAILIALLHEVNGGAQVLLLPFTLAGHAGSAPGAAHMGPALVGDREDEGQHAGGVAAGAHTVDSGIAQHEVIPVLQEIVHLEGDGIMIVVLGQVHIIVVLRLGHINLGPILLTEVARVAEVVEVAVGDEDRLDVFGAQIKASYDPAEGKRQNTMAAVAVLLLLLIPYQSRYLMDVPTVYDVFVFNYLLRLVCYFLFISWYAGCSGRAAWYYTFVLHLIYSIGTGLRRVPMMNVLEDQLARLLPDEMLRSVVYNAVCKNLVSLLVFLLFIRVFRFRSIQDGSLLAVKTLVISEVFQSFINETSYFLLVPVYAGNRLLEAAVSFYIAAIEVFVFGIFVLTVQSASRSRDNAELLAKEANNQYILTTLNDYIINEKRFRSLRHDMKNHLLVLQQMTQTDSRANAYIKKLVDEFIAPAGNRFRTGNIMLDGLFSMKYQVMEAKGISFHSSVFFDSDLSPAVTDADLSIIFGNLLDNAIEAAEKLDTGRYIRARSQKQGSYLCVTVCNSYSEQVIGRGGRLLSTKPFEGHGFGLGNVRSAMERVNGSLTIDHSDPREFWVVLLFPLEEDDEDERLGEIEHDV